MNEASTKMTAAIEQKNMQSVHVADMMLKAGKEKCKEKSKKLDLIWANQKVSENDLTTMTVTRGGGRIRGFTPGSSVRQLRLS